MPAPRLPKPEPTPVPETPKQKPASQPVADEHRGVAGSRRLTTKNTYRLDFPEPTVLARGFIRFKAAPEGGNDATGIVSLSLEGTTWQPAGRWTPASCAQAAAGGGWHVIPLAGLPKRLKATSLMVKLNYTSGLHSLVIHRVEWVER